MIPFLVIGIAAAAFFLEGCGEEKPAPEKPAEPETPRKSPEPAPAPPESPRDPSSPSDPPPAPPEAPPSGSGKKLSPEEFQKVVAGLRVCMQVQSKYKFDCPPPEELPPNCKCEVIRRLDKFDPSTPLRVREQLVPVPTDPTLPNS